MLSKVLYIFLVGGFFSGVVIFHTFPELYTELEPPEFSDEYFGPGKIPDDPDDYPVDNPIIKPFQIIVPDSVLEDLRNRLNNTRLTFYTQNTIQMSFLNDLNLYWQNEFDWKKQETELNKFNHYTTQIEGINIHFIHQRPEVKNLKLKVYPLLLVHGWPGSFAEFSKLIPLLVTPDKDRDFVFEVICPSIPGYGFSEIPNQPGFTAISAARIFSKLLDRLGIEKFFAHGSSEWGSTIVSMLSVGYQKRVIGAHLTTTADKIGALGFVKYLFGNFFPSFYLKNAEIQQFYPVSKFINFMLQETGFFHIQATKPNIIGIALNDSPLGLAAYILEKLLQWSSSSFSLQYQGLQNITVNELLTNIMIYWITNSITPSMYFYKENVNEKFNAYEFLSKYPIKVPVGFFVFPKGPLFFPRIFFEHNVKNVVQFTDISSSTCVPHLEEPILLSEDIRNLVQIVQTF